MKKCYRCGEETVIYCIELGKWICIKCLKEELDYEKRKN